MKTTYHISWEVKKTNGVKVWYVSKMFDTEAEAVALFEQKIQRANVTESHLFQNDDYYEGENLPFPETSNRTPWGWRQFHLLRSFDPWKFKGVKIWDR